MPWTTTRDRTSRAAPDAPWARSAEEVLADLEVTPETGLTEDEVGRRRQRYGRNALRPPETRGALAILVDQFRSVVVALLAVAAAISLVTGQHLEGGAILVVLALNAAIGFFTEIRAVRSMEALRRLGRTVATVRREEEGRRVPAEEIVPGDVVLLEGGDVVPADLRLVEASRFEVDESMLTGESTPVAKSIEPVAEETPVAERVAMAYRGTAVTQGAGTGVVVATGEETEIGALSTLAREAEPEATPLERRLAVLGHRLVWATLACAVLVVVTGLFGDRSLYVTIQTAIALAVAAVPEGLPIVATLALARGLLRMARRNALVKRLSAVETLGSSSVVLTDKTGTLTENRMRTARIALPEGDVEWEADGPGKDAASPPLRRAIRAAVLCNGAERTGDGEAIGDPTEIALLDAGAGIGLERPGLLEDLPEVGEEAFDPDLKMMATVHRDGERFLVAVKGAPSAVFDVTASWHHPDGDREFDPDARREWAGRAEAMAEAGLRVLALADKTVDDEGAEPYRDLVLLGLVGLVDPTRSDVREAIEACREAGIRVVMVTGDHGATALHVARRAGLADDDTVAISGDDLRPPDELDDGARARLLEAAVFARTDPARKLDLLALHQGAGSIVAMIGDGVNDAPALQKADIGVAMGQRGTEVARDAADMVLRDDRFATIVAAVEEGRVIFDNLRRFVLYLLSCNLSEILIVALASVAGAPLPLLPLQILFLNLVTDVFPALALGVGEGDADVMRRPPRNPDEPILTRSHWTAIGLYGALLTASVLTALGLALAWLGTTTAEAVTVSFLTLALGQIAHVFNMAGPESHPWVNTVSRNRWVWGAVVLCVGLVLAGVEMPWLAEVLGVVDPGPSGWALVATFGLLPLAVGRGVAMVRRAMAGRTV